jgi:1-acyl-sn-glycerol-3-phosphate acyltransferase
MRHPDSTPSQPKSAPGAPSASPVTTPKVWPDFSDLPTLRDILALAKVLLEPPRLDRSGHELLPGAHRDTVIALVRSALAHVQPELRNAQRIPRDGGVLVVGNHALMGIDSFALFPLILQHVDRLPRGLADTFLAHAPLVGRVLHNAGVVEANPGNARQLLQQGEMVVAYPGGAGESFKGPDSHYQLHWKNRRGFVRLAMRAQVPILPIMGAGIDHAYQYLFHERVLVRKLVGKDDARYDFPVSLGLGILPLPGRFTFHVGEPIVPPPDPHLADDPQAVAELHQRVWDTSQAQLDEAMRVWREEMGMDRGPR